MTTRLGRLRIVAGMDEAGFGPLLGPLTLGFSAFRVTSPGVSLWKELASAVARDPGKDRTRVVVADSKRVFTRNPRGHRRLETTALAFLALADPPWGRAPRNGGELLARAPARIRPGAGTIERHPWYAHLAESLPVWVAADDLARRTERLRAALERRRIELVDAGVRTVPAGELNASYDQTGSKSLTLWEKSSVLLAHLWEHFGPEGVECVLDRHGGRIHYGELLRARLPDARIETVFERKDACEYRAVERTSSAAGARRMRLIVTERAEEHSFAVALASCLAKYTRELCMGAFNSYFGLLQEDLRPTAGYTTDGRRWLEDAREALRIADLPPGILIRER